MSTTNMSKKKKKVPPPKLVVANPVPLFANLRTAYRLAEPFEVRLNTIELGDTLTNLLPPVSWSPREPEVPSIKTQRTVLVRFPVGTVFVVDKYALRRGQIGAITFRTRVLDRAVRVTLPLDKANKMKVEGNPGQ